ncbi:DeoR/GlpR family DNA-binding transcription regulator [Christensenella tenuis]|jgi:DeoR family transcriptional regulator, fructose operon transcriptional repressor|uniref:DeoR/GlpR transcriptional regulator n=1 Tax=Christensenella tenuis TaxID=2763033 RepID=A0ABR7EDR6_9FIRM|nr:DeoR/GlpR family DNA-binding transcription regulator [Christensenella tenuis]MBC5647798.1 DeoR/GlpR transcriptional regulator [Christensenella tenuis]
MFKAARQQKIKEIILDQTQIDVQTLSTLLNVSAVTIRSDLEDLEQEGFIVRSHGGAILNAAQNQTDTAPPSMVPDIDDPHGRENEHIAQIAAHLVQENEWIFLGSGAACTATARELLSRQGLNIITNNLNVAAVFSKNKSCNLLVTGGNLNHSGMFLSGDIFERALNGIYLSKAFISVSGIDMNGGFTVSDIDQANIYSKIRSVSKEIIFIADYTKFDEVSFMRIASLNEADAVISNEKTPEEYKEYFFNNGIKIFTSYKINPSSIG